MIVYCLAYAMQPKSQQRARRATRILRKQKSEMSLILNSLYFPLNMLRYQVDARFASDVRNRILNTGIYSS